FSPRRAWTSPARTSRCTSSLAITPPGNRLVTPCAASAGGGPPAPCASVAASSATGAMCGIGSALGAAHNTLHEPVHLQDLRQRHLDAVGHPLFALLVHERTGELVERPVDEGCFLVGDE